jgi:hypothetical protein
VDIDLARLLGGVLPPDLAQQRLSVEDDVGVVKEERQQLELGARELERAIPDHGEPIDAVSPDRMGVVEDLTVGERCGCGRSPVRMSGVE